jgi:hypothetical protein
MYIQFQLRSTVAVLWCGGESDSLLIKIHKYADDDIEYFIDQDPSKGTARMSEAAPPEQPCCIRQSLTVSMQCEC